MRLINNIDLKTTSVREVFVLIRHGVDISILDNTLDQPLTEETKPDIRVLGEQLIQLCRLLGVGIVCLRYSNRLRAVQTATIIAEELSDVGLSAEMMETPGVREVYQGKFIVRDHKCGTEYQPLVAAWNAWQAKLNACELDYRFGDPACLSKGRYEFPDLIGWFNQFGETQREFSLRLYQMLHDMLSVASDHLQVVIGHQASCSRIQRVISSVSQLSSGDTFEPGEFVRVIEKHGERMTIDHACGIVVERPEQNLTLAVLEKEIDFLCSCI